jgi:hypothetical protein
MLVIVSYADRPARIPPGNPASPADIQLTGAPTAVTRTLTGKDELLTIGIMLLLTMLVIAAALTSALVRPRPVPLMARTRDRRR